jgi:hypothetical protein
MADWRKLALDAILADGKIDETEVRLLKKALWEDGKIDRDEVKFLMELRAAARKKAGGAPLPESFDNLFYQAVQENVVSGGKIATKHVNWLRDELFRRGPLDEGGRRFLGRVKKALKAPSQAFDELYKKLMARAPAAAGGGAKEGGKAAAPRPVAKKPATAAAAPRPAAPPSGTATPSAGAGTSPGHGGAGAGTTFGGGTFGGAAPGGGGTPAGAGTSPGGGPSHETGGIGSGGGSTGTPF